MEEAVGDLDFSHAGVPWTLVVTHAQTRIPSFFLYGEAPRRDDGRTLHVETIEFRSARHSWKIRPHVHRTLHQLIFVMRGRGVSHAEGAAVEYSPPALIAVPAGTVHGFDFEPGTRGFVVSMTDDLPREISRREPGIGALFKNPATLEFPDEALRATDLARSFTMLMREYARVLPAHALALDGLLNVVLANVLRLSHVSAGSAEAVAGRHRLLVSRFRELIENAFRADWSLADYASALNVSKSRLSNACLNVTEQSPLQLVHARILLEAKRQLLYSSMSVSEIAYALGFDDPAYFTRFFSRRAGISPRTFRLRSAAEGRDAAWADG
ncbi:MAG TPA: helix-turn-helix domain-containing protein [Gammaproteobacteria bacterium]|jgi:AraC family transcriptional activator of pobA|nr:helix-turn-helix domain-containing protein [Gammaproteobacteria bacterium]